MGTKDFYRLRIGIGRPQFKEEVINYVLAKPKPGELQEICLGIANVTQHLNILLDNEYAKFMNIVNS